MEHLVTQPAIDLARGSVAVEMLTGESDAQLIGEHTVVTWTSRLTLALYYTPQIDIANGAVDDFTGDDLFIKIEITAASAQLGNHPRHHANRSCSLLQDRPILQQ
uniref:Uncharacterized protein n=1 Tax=Thermogemmatispora argillosa TaxID=2045280 RepID=A0A455T747_9CHLR|nr:hypothetical protein KTA_23430 [Thermogemmatispora argillosa]